MDTLHQNDRSPIWVYPKDDPEWKKKIIKEFKIHPVIAQVLVSREFHTVDDIHHYLYAKLPDLLDPFSLEQMDKAVERITYAISNNEPILIYGDNDVDGMTGTTLLVEYLRRVGATAFFYVSNPGIHRDNIITEALTFAKEKQCKLLITVDCGVTACEEIAKVTQEGIDVIITDHHEPTHSPPKCTATLNPKLVGNTYPNRDLTGVGVAFKLAHGLTKHLIEMKVISPKRVDLKRYLDLVALGTISDMGALKGENRIMVRYGLNQIRQMKRIGLSQLLKVCEMETNQITPFTVASKIAPRLNSLGRIADPSKGVEMLLIRNTAQAEKMALELDLNNIERQKIERTMSEDVESIIQKDPDILLNKAIMMASDNWHPGVIPIISTRISKLHNRPTIMIAIDKGVGKGSIRSIPEFPLLPVLKESADILLNFGGHDFAAGLTIAPEKIELFKKRFLAAADLKLQDSDVITKLHLDAQVDFDEITFEFLESISLLEPFGNENPQPILYCEVKQAWPPKVVGKSHLKMYLEQGDRLLEGIFFGMGHMSTKLRRKDLRLQVAFTPQVNNFQGPSIQLLIRDFKILDDEETQSSQ